MKSAIVSCIVIVYGFALMAVGITIAVTGQHYAPIVMLGGIGGGILVMILGAMWRRRILWSRAALATAVGIFSLSFVWRAIEAWLHQSTGSGLLLLVLAVVSIPIFILLVRHRNQ
ncbi:MAG: hypothetical protein N2663_05170 [Chlorobi bacterium]|nr:hypothetical protein [Chlorobiota bacterium]